MENSMSTTKEGMVVYDPQTDIQLWRAPGRVLVEAQQAAKALQERIAGKKKPVVFNGEQYIEFDDWEMIAHFYGYVPKVESTEHVEFGSVQGFQATAVLLNERTGLEASRATSMCLNDEENWGLRIEYDWQDVLDNNGKKIWDKGLRGGKGGYVRERVKVGERATPLFQLLSMAQTRACAKVCRNKLSWVVTLAGYKPTPAEEIDERTLPVEDEQPGRPQAVANGPVAMPARKATPVAQPAPVQVAPARKPCPECGEPLGERGCNSCGWMPPFANTTPPPADRETRRMPEPPRHSAPPSQSARTPQGPKISEKQSKMFFAVSMSNGKTAPEQRAYLKERWGISDSRDIVVGEMFDECIAWARGGGGQ